MAACAVDSGILALVDHSLNESDYTQIFPVLLDYEGRILSSSGDLEIKHPRFADMIPTGSDAALLVRALACVEWTGRGGPLRWFHLVYSDGFGIPRHFTG